MSNDVTKFAANCDDCGLITKKPCSSADILQRLPEALFNLTPGSKGVPGSEWEEEVITDEAVFGVIPGTEFTPQAGLAQILADEKERILHGLRQAEADQLGLGIMSTAKERVAGQCPHAQGRDLDRVGQQYGIARPLGFTDCCYWRLVVLMLFKPGPTCWVCREVSQLYTAQRPRCRELPNIVELIWPFSGVAKPFWSNESDTPLAFWDSLALWRDEGSFVYPGGDGEIDGWWSQDGDMADGRTFWDPAPPLSPGMLLEQAISLVKPAGIVVRYVNKPRRGGCFAATTTHAAAIRGRWNRNLI